MSERLPLFQYWDSGEPPPDVAELIDGLRRDNPDLDHRLFDETTAAAFIAEHCGQRELSAFRACAVPAMQADYFRLCALRVCGGLYIDADCYGRQPLSGLLENVSEALMVSLGGYLTTGVMVFRRPDNPFIRANLELATDNIESQVFDSVYIATGPPVSDAVRAIADPAWFSEAFERADEWNRGMRFGRLLERARSLISPTPELKSAFGDVRIIPHEQLVQWVGTKRAAYKGTDVDWRRWKGSIYRNPVSTP